MASPFDARYNTIRDKVIYYAKKHGIDTNIAIWQIWAESSFNPKACSNANACGIAQFIPDTAKRFGVNRNDIDSSLDGYGKYMAVLLKRFNNRYDLALAGYNSGEYRNEYTNAAKENRPINWKVLPRGVQTETQNYVNKILKAANKNSNTQSIANNSVVSNAKPQEIVNKLLTDIKTDKTTQYLMYGFGFLVLAVLIRR